jgi:hypothetical protein
MITGNDHERHEDYSLVFSLADSSHHIFKRRSSFDSSYKVILETVSCENFLHFRIYGIGFCLCSVAHEANGGLAAKAELAFQSA